MARSQLRRAQDRPDRGGVPSVVVRRTARNAGRQTRGSLPWLPVRRAATRQGPQVSIQISHRSRCSPSRIRNPAATEGTRSDRPSGRRQVRAGFFRTPTAGRAIGARLIRALRGRSPGDLELTGVGRRDGAAACSHSRCATTPPASRHAPPGPPGGAALRQATRGRASPTRPGADHRSPGCSTPRGASPVNLWYACNSRRRGRGRGARRGPRWRTTLITCWHCCPSSQRFPAPRCACSFVGHLFSEMNASANGAHFRRRYQLSTDNAPVLCLRRAVEASESGGSAGAGEQCR
jgi:hypothetical protein